MTKTQTYKMFQPITNFGTREMTWTRFHEAVKKSEMALLAEIKAMTEHLSQEERNEYFDKG